MAPDHLVGWLQARAQVAWRDVVPAGPGPVRARRDGFADHARVRGDARLLAAQDAVRRAAGTATTLTPDLLAGWNAITLGVPAVEFRRGPAYAKDGRERYGLHPDTAYRFAACLAEAADPAVPLAARAARVYLDIAFFHPYADGNARLGGLALQFVLLREQTELDDVAPILTVVRRADDPDGAASLARLVYGTASATRRRSTPPNPARTGGERMSEGVDTLAG
ncbi:Fic family protein [Hamadaea tsunoensis]|uniref:Fic family protein n=1 Tax=Hamadaea tsunoensis TaxID=53368 RepID=UPI0003F5F80D|nr:Fic family protein [Hamadaea tsunoensis]